MHLWKRCLHRRWRSNNWNVAIKIYNSIFSNTLTLLKRPDVNFKEVTVGARDVYTETVHISKHGATLAWEFSTVSYNIQFGIVYENGENVISSN